VLWHGYGFWVSYWLSYFHSSAWPLHDLSSEFSNICLMAGSTFLTGPPSSIRYFEESTNDVEIYRRKGNTGGFETENTHLPSSICRTHVGQSFMCEYTVHLDPIFSRGRHVWNTCGRTHFHVSRDGGVHVGLRRFRIGQFHIPPPRPVAIKVVSLIMSLNGRFRVRGISARFDPLPSERNQHPSNSDALEHVF
jgi:hypothetical protein